MKLTKKRVEELIEDCKDPKNYMDMFLSSQYYLDKSVKNNKILFFILTISIIINIYQGLF